MKAIHFHTSHEFPVSRRSFFEDMTFHEPFNVALHRHLGFRRRELVKMVETDETIYQRIEYETNRKVPWLFRALFGGTWVSYAEHLTLYRDAFRIETELEPMVMKGRISARGVMVLEELGPHRCRRTYDVHIQANIPLAGVVIARSMHREVQDGYERTAEFIERWILEHRLGEAPESVAG